MGIAVDFYESGRSILPGVDFSLIECCRIFKVSDNAAYERRKNLDSPKVGKREESDQRAKECIRNVVDGMCHGWVFGARMLHDMIRAHFGVLVNKKRIPRLLDEMGLKLSTRWNNPYLGHDTHDHPCDSFRNLVRRNFYVAPRKIILTDITYLWYNYGHTVFYKCSFLDAFTAEELGTAVSENMDVKLLMAAYEDMMDGHRDEIPDDAIIHSDNGSQMLSDEFKERVREDGFRQSNSDRGNALDNSPMESFFGTFKDENFVKILLCDTFEEASKVIMDYKDFYNNVRTHTSISGWMPAAFYEHCVSYEGGTDQSECKFKVPECMAEGIADAIANRKSQNKPYVANGAADGRYALNGGAEGQMDRDHKKLSLMIKKCEKELDGKREEYQNLVPISDTRPGIVSRVKDRIKNLENRILELKGVQGLIEKAREFYRNATEAIRTKLDDRRYWQDHPQMSYYRKMKGMF